MAPTEFLRDPLPRVRARAHSCTRVQSAGHSVRGWWWSWRGAHRQDFFATAGEGTKALWCGQHQESGRPDALISGGPYWARSAWGALMGLRDRPAWEDKGWKGWGGKPASVCSLCRPCTCPSLFVILLGLKPDTLEGGALSSSSF